MGEAGQPDAVPAVALHTLICNHISCTDGRRVRKAEERLLAVCVITSICLGLYCVYHVCESIKMHNKIREHSRTTQVLNKDSIDFTEMS